MTSLPIRRKDFDVQGFAAFLAANGCEIGTPTNSYEVVRYRAYWQGSKRPVTHIVYAKETGLLTWMHGSQAHYNCFLAGSFIPGNNPPFESQLDKPAHQRRADMSPPSPISKNAATRAKLIARDGDGCWFCGGTLGEDATIEHLIPKARGGLNSLANYVLAHRQCNADAADLPLVEKIAMRDRLLAKEPHP